MANYLDSRRKLIEKLNISRDLPDLITCWSAFVEECEEGYSWDVSEYNNEIRVRNELEQLLTNSELIQFQEHKLFEDAVQEIDNRFRRLLHTNYQMSEKQEWWMRGVLSAAGEEYVKYYKKAHGFDIDLKE